MLTLLFESLTDAISFPFRQLRRPQGETDARPGRALHFAAGPAGPLPNDVAGTDGGDDQGASFGPVTCLPTLWADLKSIRSQIAGKGPPERMAEIEQTRAAASYASPTFDKWGVEVSTNLAMVMGRVRPSGSQPPALALTS